MATTRRTASALLLALTLLLAACGTEDVSDTATTPSAASSSPAEDLSEDEASEPADADEPELDEEDVADVDPEVCEATAGMLQLIGDASNPANDADQVRDAVELMGQTVIQLEDVGADAAVVEAADAIHAQFASIVGDPDAIPDLAVVEAAGQALREVVESCGLTDLSAADTAAEPVDGDAEAGQTATDPVTCAATNAFVTAAIAFTDAEIGSQEESDALAAMETTAFDFAQVVMDADLVQAVFTLYEDAQGFVETGEFGDVGGEGMLVDSVYQACIADGLIEG